MDQCFHWVCKEYFIGVRGRPCVGLKCGFHENKDISSGLTSRSSDWRKESDMIKKKNVDGVHMWNSIYPYSSLCVNQCMINFLRVWFKEKNSKYSSKSGSWYIDS
jgi:hypothetical protein